MGWLGWSYEQTMTTPMPMIELALEGLLDRLKVVHGGGTAEPAPPDPEKVFAAFRAAGAPRQ